MIKDAMGPAVGPSQFAVETKGGCALLQWALHMVMKAKPSLVGASLDAMNAYGEIERECIEAAIKANPYLHSKTGYQFFFGNRYISVFLKPNPIYIGICNSQTD